MSVGCVARCREEPYIHQKSSPSCGADVFFTVPTATMGEATQVLVFGEVLCDLFSARPGLPIAETEALRPLLGGAPANVAVQVARLGHRVALVSGVGADPFGQRLTRLLRAEGVLTDSVFTVPGRRTGATLVEVDADGERRFFGFREASADLALSAEDVDTAGVRRHLRTARIVHCGTVSMRSDSARGATRAIMAGAAARGAIRSVDVNLRPGMYPDQQTMLDRALEILGCADVVKATVDEAALLVGTRATGSKRLRALADGLLKKGPRLIFLTDGEGTMGAFGARTQALLPALKARAVDATGAGDAFVGAVLAGLVADGVGVADVAELDEGKLTSLLRRGRRAGAAAVRAVGATTAMIREPRR